MLDILLVFALVFLILYHLKSSRLPPDFPPGPRAPLPIIGDAYILRGNFTKGFRELAKKYGDIYGLWLGSNRCVVLSNFEDIQELLGRYECATRIPFNIARIVQGRLSVGPSIPGVLFASYETWSSMRRFSLHTLRDFGFGKQALEDIVDEEVEDLIEDINTKLTNKSSDVREFFNLYAVGGLWRIVSGERVKKDDDRLKFLVHKIRVLAKEQNNPLVNMTMNHPNAFLLAHKLGLVAMLEGFWSLRSYCRKIIDGHSDSEVDLNALDFTEAFMKRIQETSDPQDPFYGDCGDNNLENVLADFFIAGSDTTANALNWAMVFMILNPDIQEKVHLELVQTFGKTGKVTMKDRHLTPYTEAVLHEVTRRGNILPMAVWHCTTKEQDVKYKGFRFPPKTGLIPLIGDVMHDPEHFSNPYEFNPDRYLSEDNGTWTFNPHPRVIPFGVGKRRCLGEALARVQLYKFFAGIMMNFQVASGQIDPISVKPEPGFVQAPCCYKLVFKPRM